MSAVDVDNSGSALPKVVIKSEDLWREHRDVVLYTVKRTEDAEVYTMYGLLKSTLSLGSEILDSIFDGPQDAFTTASESYEGLPTMRMHDDPADLDAFLHAIYFPGFLQEQLEDHKDTDSGLQLVPPSYPGILRLAQKLVAPPGVLSAVASAFEEVYSPYMRKWMDREAMLIEEVWDDLHMLIPSHMQGVVEGDWDITAYFPDPVPVYLLAKEHSSLYNILPTVAYDIMHVRRAYDPANMDPFRRIDLSLLAEHDRQNLEQGGAAYRADCEQKFSFDAFTSLSLIADHCDRTERARSADELACFPGLQGFWERRVTPSLSPNKPMDLMAFSVKCLEESICVSCTSAVHRHLENAQYYIWAKLPVYFHLTGYVAPLWGMVSSISDEKRLSTLLPHAWWEELTAIWGPEAM